MSAVTDRLGDLSRTAWLTAWCHDRCGAAWGLERPVSSWLIQRFGRPGFAGELSFFTLHGVAARAAWIDARLRDALEKLGVAGESAEVWSFGAGFDSRWEWIMRDHGRTVSCYREFDLEPVLSAKDETLRDSPWASSWAGVARHPGDVMAGLPLSLPATGAPVLAVVEGLLDYFDRERKLALLAAIRDRAPRSVILLDAQSAWLLARNNRQATRATGNAGVNFAWAPDDPLDFYGREAGFRVESRYGMLPDLMRRRWWLLRALPLPRRLHAAYTLLQLRPQEAEPSAARG